MTGCPPERPTTTDIGHRTMFVATSGITGPRVGVINWVTQGPDETSIELATICGPKRLARTVSPNNQTIRPSGNRVLVPIPAARHPGRLACDTPWLSCAAEVVRCLFGGGGHGRENVLPADAG